VFLQLCADLEGASASSSTAGDDPDASSSKLADDSGSDKDGKGKKKNRCVTCRKKVGLTGMQIKLAIFNRYCCTQISSGLRFKSRDVTSLFFDGGELAMAPPAYVSWRGIFEADDVRRSNLN